MEKITKFLETYWWIWLILLAAYSVFLVFGEFDIGSFLGALIGSIFIMAFIHAFIGLIWSYTFGRGQTKSWGVFRILGILGVLFFMAVLYFGPFDGGKKNIDEALANSFFNFASLGLILSLFLFVIGEIFLYLDNLQNSIKDILDRIKR